jgi:hypothetical protein
MRTRAVKYGLGVAASVLALAISAKAQDYVIVNYYFQQADGSIVRGGSYPTTDHNRYGGNNYAIVCGGLGCVSYGEKWCEGCHGGAVDRTRFTNHLTTYFPRAEFPVAEGQRVKMSTMIVTRLNGLLVLEDERGRRFQLPPGAMVLKARSGRPEYVGYPGAAPPVLR